jgi:hypothetical protein
MICIPFRLSRCAALIGPYPLTLMVPSIEQPSHAPTNPPPPGGAMAGPPHEALPACADKTAEVVCQMTLPGQDIHVSGQCVANPDAQLACLPEGALAPPPPSN